MALSAQLIGAFLDKKFLAQIISTIVTYYAIKLFHFVRARRRRYRLFGYYGIPVPETYFFGGNIDAYMNDLSLKSCVEHYQKYGKVYGIYVGDEPSLIIVDLQILKKIFFESNKSFTERSLLFLSSQTIAHSLLFAPYKRWKSMRKVMLPLFNGYQMRSESVRFVDESVRLMQNYIEEKVEKSNDAKIQLDIQDLMKATALHMISSMAVKLEGVKVMEDEKHVKSLDSFLRMSDRGVIIYLIRYPILKWLVDYIAKHYEYDEQMAIIHRGLYKTIDEGMKKIRSQKQRSSANTEIDMTKSQENLIDTLIRLHYEGKFTRDEVVGNADAVLFAGYDTTSTTLTYVFWALGKHIDIQDRLRSDLMTYGTDSEYLEQVINETMRLYPTVATFTTRVATETVEIDDLVIPQGSKVIYNSFLIHRHPDFWPDPLKFDPERFRKGKEIHPCAFAPFGLGDRKCLGYNLAMLEMKLIVCNTVLRYKIRTISPDDLEIIAYANVLTKPKEKVRIELQKNSGD